MVYPKDGIPDSRREEFEVTLDESEAARSVIIRATDAMNNVATAVAEVEAIACAIGSRRHELSFAFDRRVGDAATRG